MTLLKENGQFLLLEISWACLEKRQLQKKCAAGGKKILLVVRNLVLGLCSNLGSQVGARVAAGVASVRRHQKLPWCQTVPAGSTIDPVLVKAEPISDLTTEKVDVPWRKLQPVESPHWSRLLAGTVSCGEEPIQETTVDPPQHLEHLDSPHPFSSATPVSHGHHMILLHGSAREVELCFSSPVPNTLKLECPRHRNICVLTFCSSNHLIETEGS